MLNMCCKLKDKEFVEIDAACMAAAQAAQEKTKMSGKFANMEAVNSLLYCLCHCEKRPPGHAAEEADTDAGITVRFVFLAKFI